MNGFLTQISCSLRFLIGSALLLATTTLKAGVFITDFNSGPPAGASLYGTAYVDSFGGVGDSGVLKLTDAFNSQQGSMVIDDLDGGPITFFLADFKMLIGGGSGADGLSFNFANDLPNDSFGEEGAGTGLTISFDSFNNGGGEAPAIDVKQGGATLASIKGSLDLFRTGDWIPVRVLARPDGSLDLTVNGTTVVSSLVGAFPASGGRFGFGARTGGSTDNHWVDDISIITSNTLPAHPFVASISPEGVGAREDAIVRVVIRDGVAAVNLATIRLALNGAAVAATIAKSGNTTTVSYDPPGLLPSGALNNATITFTDNGASPFTQSVSFAFQVRYYIGPTGNIYDLIAPEGGITWEDARIDAESRTYRGRPGHLATLTTYEEDVFANKVRTTTLPGSAGWQVWAGGYQDFGLSPTEGWHWVNNEGPISGVNGGATYTNWRAGEPNDYYGPDSENYLGIGLFGEFTWNDDGYFGVGRLPGYVIEYESPRVTIDIKPGSYPNVVNVEDQGKVTVGLLSSAGFNATKVNVSAIRFGRTGLEAAPVGSAVKDLNGDGRLDLSLTFNVRDTGWRCGDSEGLLIGKDADGLPFSGKDSVQLNGCPEYGLAMTALQDVNRNTDVQLQVTPLLPGYVAPTAANQAQFKSYKITGQLGWTRSVNSIPLTIGADGSSIGSVRFNDVLHFQKIDGKVNITNSKNKNTEVIRAETRVLYRPDLALQNLVAPSRANAYQLINISVGVSELNGDLGATTDALLLDNGVVVDSAAGLNVARGSEIGLVFARRFTDVGVHTMKIVLTNEQPGDFDPANNEVSFNIDVVQPPLTPVYYDASYYHYENEQFQEWDDDYSTGTYHETYKNESFYENLYLPVAVTFPIGSIAVKVSADGVQKIDVTASDIPGYTYDYGCVKVGYGSTYLGDQTFAYIQSYRDDCSLYETSSVQISTYAYSDVYFSAGYYKYWGYGWENSYDYSYGTFLDATGSIGSRIIIDAPEGKFGGDGSIPTLYNYSDYYPYENIWDTGFVRGFSRYSNTYGYNSGITTP